MENVTIKDRELTVDKQDNGITNKVSKRDKVKLYILHICTHVLCFNLIFEEDLLHPVYLPGGAGQDPAGDGDCVHHRDELLSSVMLRPGGVTERRRGKEGVARGQAS